DHLPGACRDLALDLIDPSLGRDDVGPVLAPHLGEHGEVLRQPLDVSELLGEGDLDGAVGDLDVLEVVGLEERDVLAQLLAVPREVEEPPTAAHGDAVSPERLELGLEVLHHHRRRPAELDDVDVARAHLEHALDLADGKALVEHLREADLAWLRGAARVAEYLRPGDGGHRCRQWLPRRLPSTARAGCRAAAAAGVKPRAPACADRVRPPTAGETVASSPPRSTPRRTPPGRRVRARRRARRADAPQRATSASPPAHLPRTRGPSS